MIYPFIKREDKIIRSIDCLYFNNESSIKMSYGYVADPSLPKWKNITNVIGQLSTFAYFNRPSNMTFHNLCEIKQPKINNIGVTLGLGLKFCVQQKFPKRSLEESFTRFTDDIRRKYFFASSDDGTFVMTKLYVKSKWIPPQADAFVEGRLSKLRSSIQCDHNKILSHLKPASNLTRLQQTQLKYLKSNPDFIILNCDKNLGPAIIERDVYIKCILDEHLLKTCTYTQLNENEGLDKLIELRETLTELIFKEYKKNLCEDVIQYFKRSLSTTDLRIPVFYGMPKVHKPRKIKNNIIQPVPFRPVISQCGSLGAIISTYIDYELQKLTKYVPSYIKNSKHLLDELDKLPVLPASARLFTADAQSMYTNIDPDEGIPVLRKYLEKYNMEAKSDINIDLVCKLTDLVMRNNVFKFGDTWWYQKIGTAMGTPCACIYATIFFAWFEREMILQHYKENMYFYRRQIDDIFAIWIPDESNPNAWSKFKLDLQNYCKLKWDIDEPNTSVNFLDLTISIDNNGKVQYKTFQKPMNLFLYIPAHSAHPPGLLKSLIYGLIGTYARQNSNKSDYLNMIQLLWNRLIDRGYTPEKLLSIFEDATTKIKKKQDDNIKKTIENTRNCVENSTNLIIAKPDDKPNQVFFHLQYHPRGISRNKIQAMYQEICATPDSDTGQSFKGTDTVLGGTFEIDKLTVAYSRAQNLRDILNPTTMEEFEGKEVSTFIASR